MAIRNRWVANAGSPGHLMPTRTGCLRGVGSYPMSIILITAEALPSPNCNVAKTTTLLIANLTPILDH